MSKFLLSLNDTELANQVSSILIQNNFEVIGEPNLEKDFAQVKEAKPDFVIMSIMDNESKNWKLHSQLRTSHEIEQLPVLVIASRSHKYDKLPGLVSTRLDDYVTYPFDLDDFLLRIRYLLDRATSMKQT